jgi:L,D-peptidoglycan transpeptidase YkuD (ErfK/YbiS/YcfS/YnhG family)
LITTCKAWRVLAWCLLPLGLRAQMPEPVSQLLALSQQMVVVTAGDWDASRGTMQRMEFDRDHWQPAGRAMPVVLGSNGLGWGVGLHPANLPGPKKLDRDGRSPAGVFWLPYSFGYAPADEVRAIRLPYIQCTGSVECVEDTNSAYYNIVKDRRTLEKVDWKESEKMRVADDQFRLGVFVANNADLPEPGRGACVFLHIWKAPGAATDGGTAMSMGAMESLVGWLDPRSRPVLVQLPLPAYEAYRSKWQLPPAPLPAGGVSGKENP